MTTLRELGELELIRRLSGSLPAADDVMVGVGDDAAVVALDGAVDLLLTSDAVVEGTHFDAVTTPERIGRKAVGRALSDIAAMGGEPAWALIDLVAPGNAPVERIEEAYAGASALAAACGLAVIGGDTTEGPVFELHVFAVGRVPRGRALLRSGASPGSGIFVTGALGGSLDGKHLDFAPRVREAMWLRSGGWAESMIDVSDGLAADLHHILERSRVGAWVDEERVPLAPAARRARDERTPLEHALYDGEDFELLFTVPSSRAAAFPAAWSAAFDLDCTRVGTVTSAAGRFTLRGPSGKKRLIARDGYQHFG